MNNKISISIITLGLCAAALLTSCNNNPANNDITNTPDRGGITESTISSEPEKAHFIIKDTPAKNPVKTTYSKDGELLNSLEIEDLSITQHERVDKQAAAKMKEVIIAQGEKRILAAYDSNNETLLADMQNENFDASKLPHKIAVDYTCTRNDGRAISILETTNSYAAGELLNTITSSYNFVPLTGERIRQPFYTSNSSEEFNAADNTMYEKLVSKYGEEVISYDNVTASFVDVAEECWYFTQDGKGVAVVFSAGRIAPEEAGILEIEYTKEELPEFAQKYFN